MTAFLRRALREAAVLVALAAVAGLSVNALRPRGLALTRQGETDLAPRLGLEEIGLGEALSLHRSGAAVFVDARDRDFFEFERIEGAVSLPLDDFDQLFPRREESLRNAPAVVAYCDGENCPLARKLARRLAREGISAVRVFTGGLEEWTEAGGPVEGGESAG